jgi:hypothetical protein
MATYPAFVLMVGNAERPASLQVGRWCQLDRRSRLLRVRRAPDLVAVALILPIFDCCVWRNPPRRDRAPVSAGRYGPLRPKFNPIRSSKMPA